MKIVVDAFGGDYAPGEIIKGVIDALNKHQDLKVVLSGDKDKITDELMKEIYASDRLEILHAPDVVSNSDLPAFAVRRKKFASLPMAFDYLKEFDDCDALISAGPSGVMLAGGILKIGRMKGIKRPAMAPLLPTQNGGKVMLLDAGANAECDANNLLQFAIMGDIYMKSMGIKRPKIALLNIGTEDEKGDTIRKEAFELLKNSNLRFKGNIEARDILKGNIDVVVADGFSGNIALKSIEGTAEFVMNFLKNELNSGLKNKIGALLLKNTFKKMKSSMDYKQFGGAPLLGFEKILLKSHGDSKRETIALAIDNAIKLKKQNMIENIKKAVEEVEKI